MKLSGKVKGISPSPTLAVDTKAKQMKKEGHDIIGFGAGEPDFDTPDYVKAAASRAMEEGFTKYTAVAGIPELKDAISKYLKECGLDYNANQIIVNNGAKHSLFNVLYSILDPGDKVLIPSPYWVTYPELVKICGGIPVFIPTRESEDFRLKADAIESLIDKDTKAIIVNSPNNPTGALYSKEDLEEIAKIAQAYDLIIISDEIYEKFIYNGQHHISISTISQDAYERTIVVNGLSKTFAMTGWRIGYTAGPEPLIKAMNSLQSHTTSNANSIAQKAGAEALLNISERDKFIATMVSEFNKRREYMVNRINNMPYLSCINPKGAFYVFMNITQTFGQQIDGNVIKDSTTFAQNLLEQYKVAVVPGIGFGADGYVRLSYATSMENIIKGLDRIEEFVNRLI